MIIKTLQWNIGGGKILKSGADPSLLASYSEDGIEQICQTIKVNYPDIITLQEVQKDETTNQAKLLANKLDYQHYCFYDASDSHIDEGHRLGMAILSKFPIVSHSFELFHNPKYQAVWEDGSMATSYDKGIITARLRFRNGELMVQTLHLIPFRRFEIEALSEATDEVRKDVTSKINTDFEPFILQGDFNFDNESLKEFLPDIFKNNLAEVRQKEATTPKGRRLDHVLYRGLEFSSAKTISDVLTDHYPIITEFNL